jgi:hypothetical protein
VDVEQIVGYNYRYYFATSLELLRKNIKILHQNIQSQGQGLNLGLPGYELTVSKTQPQLSVKKGLLDQGLHHPFSFRKVNPVLALYSFALLSSV